MEEMCDPFDIFDVFEIRLIGSDDLESLGGNPSSSSAWNIAFSIFSVSNENQEVLQ